ncbi:MAG: sugar phosphate isomerase/epimerase [Synergistaceae bacterium]|jgi:sugar phosphate isomerase/epimerase|nr:sugar phosphate isomerase/epimerase [Synergistaceae bacterium]
MKLGCCISIGQYDDLCALGYDFAELSGYETAGLSEADVSRLAGKIQERGVPCLGFNAYCRDNVPMVGPGYDRKKAREYAALLARRGNLLGAKNLGIGSPLARRLPKGYDLKKADEQMKEFLTITAEEADKWGMTVLYEALNPLTCDYGIGTLHALNMVETLSRENPNLKNLAMVLDFHHKVLAGEAADDFAGAMPWVRHLHINGITEDKRKRFPEAADADFCRRALKAAEALGYDGTVSVEADPGEKSFLEDARRSLEILREIIRY